jgi:hypothetical protein
VLGTKEDTQDQTSKTGVPAITFVFGQNHFTESDVWKSVPLSWKIYLYSRSIFLSMNAVMQRCYKEECLDVCFGGTTS